MSIITSIVQFVLTCVVLGAIYLLLPRKGQRVVNRIIIRLGRKIAKSCYGFKDDAEEVRIEDQLRVMQDEALDKKAAS